MKILVTFCILVILALPINAQVTTWDFTITTSAGDTGHGLFTLGKPFTCEVFGEASDAPILSLAGVFDGSNMNFLNPAPATCAGITTFNFAAGRDEAVFGHPGLFTLNEGIQFRAGGIQWGLGETETSVGFLGRDHSYGLASATQSFEDNTPTDNTIIVSITEDPADLHQPPVATPEPSTLLLIACGLVCIFLLKILGKL